MSYLQSLSVFWTVMDEGSFSGAAKRLALTQPTISFHIDNLEKRFGCPLFTRTAKGVSPTIYGQTLYDLTIPIHSLAEKSENTLRSMVAGTGGCLKIGASTIPAQYILPQIIGDFLQNKPGITVSLIANDSSSILRQFENGELPIAVIGFPVSSAEAVPVFHDELMLVAHPDFPWQAEKALPPEDLASIPLVVRESSSGSRKTVADALAARGIAWDTLHITAEAGGNEACKELIKKKVGAGFLSGRAVAGDLQNGSLRRLELPGIKLTRTFFALAAKPLLPSAVESFWRFMLSRSAVPQTTHGN